MLKPFDFVTVLGIGLWTLVGDHACYTFLGGLCKEFMLYYCDYYNPPPWHIYNYEGGATIFYLT